MITTLCFIVATQTSSRATPARVLVVVNQASQDSRTIGRYYVQRRQIPAANVLSIQAPTGEELSKAEFEKTILAPVKRKIGASKTRIDYIVLTRGTPIRVREGGYSVDALLSGMNLSITPITELKPEEIQKRISPYFGKDEPFDSKKFNMYLVTRLTGYDVAQAKALVDRSMKATASPGLFFFDQADNRKTEGYGALQSLMPVAAGRLTQLGFVARVDEDPEFRAPIDTLMGYVSWGSNDGAFDVWRYRSLEFRPGAIAETFVSTSARSFERAVQRDGGQSVIGDLIEAGVTGVKGYVSEPYTFALARPDLLFDRYVRGRNLAEAFYSASLVVKWKDIVVGDPLCAPYAKR